MTKSQDNGPLEVTVVDLGPLHFSLDRSNQNEIRTAGKYSFRNPQGKVLDNFNLKATSD